METIEINNFNHLSNGENLGQIAALAQVENGIVYEILSENSDLEYIDFLNLTRAVEVLAEFFDVNTVSVSNNNLLCSVALGSSIEDAFQKAMESEPLALIGGTVGFSKEVTSDVVKLLKSMNVKNIIAPSYSKGALNSLLEFTQINVIQIKSPLQELLGFITKDIKVTPFGYLVQEQNFSKLTKQNFKVAGKVKPTQQQAEDAIFAWKVAKYAKSNSVVIAKDLSTKAIVQGAANNITCAEQAMDIACENPKDAVMAVDSLIENEEVINAAIQGRIGLIIEAGNGFNSKSIVKLADKYELSIIHTGVRNYRY